MHACQEKLQDAQAGRGGQAGQRMQQSLPPAGVRQCGQSWKERWRSPGMRARTCSTSSAVRTWPLLLDRSRLVRLFRLPGSVADAQRHCCQGQGIPGLGGVAVRQSEACMQMLASAGSLDIT